MDDNELIYSYRSDHNESAKEILINKYFPILVRTINKNIMVNDILFEKSDFYSLAYFTIINNIENYDIKQNRFSFSQSVFRTS
jgi:DNA-directed RNA polymerase specialized sigma subunit